MSTNDPSSRTSEPSGGSTEQPSGEHPTSSYTDPLAPQCEETPFQHGFARAFDHIDDLFYALIGVFLAITAGLIMWTTGQSVLSFFDGQHDPIHVIVEIIDRLLLGLMVIEILYTIRVSIRQHSLKAQPFLVVGLIAAVRRVLVISVEAGSLVKTEPEVFRNLVLEIGVLGVLVLVFVVSLLLMRRQGVE
jgi:uncharacterized membrane protein (DUF373 family)